MSFDTDSLERAISTRQQEIKRILDELTKIRSDLLEAEDELVQKYNIPENHDSIELRLFIRGSNTAVMRGEDDDNLVFLE